MRTSDSFRWSVGIFTCAVVAAGTLSPALQAQDPKLIVLGKSAYYLQNSSGPAALAPGDQMPWRATVAVMGFAQSDFSSVTVTSPGGSPQALQWLPDDGEWGFPDDIEFATKAELNADVPDSTTPYQIAVTPAGGGSVSSSLLVLNGDAFPDAPHVTNFTEAQAVDPTQPFTLAWDTFAGGTAQDFILVFIWQGDSGDIFSSPLPGASGVLTGVTTSVEIPAGTLQPENAYQCEVMFLNVVDTRTGDIPGATGYAFYAASTKIALTTAAAPVPKLHLVGKNVRYQQSSTGAASMVPTSDGPWTAVVGAIGFEAADFSAVAATRPGFAPVALQWFADEEMWGLYDDPEFATQAELDAQFPDSASPYVMSFTPTGGGAVVNSSVVLNGGAYPTAPHISNFNAAQQIDPSQPFTLAWDAFAGGTADDAILVFVSTNDGPDVYSSAFPGGYGALTGEATSVQIPGGTLQPGRTYSCEVNFLNIVDRRTGDLPGATGYAIYLSSTELTLATTGTAVGPLSTDFQFHFTHQQGSLIGTSAQLSFPVTTSYSPTFVEFDDPNPPDTVTITGPVGSQLESGVASTGYGTWGNNGRGYYVNALPTGPTPPNYPPAGTYSVQYGSTNYQFSEPDSNAATLQVVAIPSFSFDGANNLTAVSWTLHTPNGEATSLPASFVRAAINIRASGVYSYHDGSPAAGTVTLESPVPWSSVEWVDVSFEDSLNNSYRSSFAVAVPPTITGHPVSQTVTAGGSIVLSVQATGDSPLTYQWRRNGQDIVGATSSTLTLPSAQAFHDGAYTVVVTSAGGSVTSSEAVLAVNAAPSSLARLENLSTRALCLTGDNLLIPGFVINGADTKRLLIRAAGPELVNFGVTGVLADPRIVLKRSEQSTTIDVAANDNWGTNANVADIVSTTTTVGAFELTPGSLDAALLVDLVPGAYTVLTSGANEGTGVSIVELYDASGAGSGSRLANISNRGFVGTGGDIMIPGFVISAEGSKTLLLRAVGPKLTEFGVSGVLEDPMLSVFRVDPATGLGQRILTNDNWGENGDATTVVATAAQVGAFELDANSKDAAFVVSLPPGVYTAQASGVGGTTGVAIVEVYVVE